MLKMKCPGCGQFISSSFLAELEMVPCEHCGNTVPVENLLVSARGFTIGRDDLLKRIFRYQQLLSEVSKERELLEASGDASRESRKSIDQFLATLEELLCGARSHFRLNFSEPVPARFTVDHRVLSGKLINLSMVGACIELEGHDSLPRARTSANLEFSLTDRPSAYSLAGTVAWVRKEGRANPTLPWVGFKFKNLPETDRADLWQFIANSQGEKRRVA